MARQFLDYKNTADYLGLNMNTLYSLVARGDIPHYRLSGRLVRFAKEELIEWIRTKSIGERNTPNSDPEDGGRP